MTTASRDTPTAKAIQYIVMVKHPILIETEIPLTVMDKPPKQMKTAPQFTQMVKFVSVTALATHSAIEPKLHLVNIVAHDKAVFGKLTSWESDFEYPTRPAQNDRSNEPNADALFG